MMQCFVLILSCAQLASFQQFGVSLIHKYRVDDGLGNILWEGVLMAEFLFFALSSCLVVFAPVLSAPGVIVNQTILMMWPNVGGYTVILNCSNSIFHLPYVTNILSDGISMVVLQAVRCCFCMSPLSVQSNYLLFNVVSFLI